SPDVAGAFERSFFLLSTDEIAEMYKDLAAEPRNGWKRGLIPFLDDEQEDFVGLDTTQAGTPVVECWRGQTHPSVTAPALTKWLGDFAAELANQQYHEDPERGNFHRKA